MIYGITNSEELLNRMRGINSWIEENQNNIGNANMYEIISCMLARNNIRALEEPNAELDAEVEKMISLRSDSINEFQSDVPESKELFDAVRDGMAVFDFGEMELICRSQSIPFFINNARKRGFDGDITMPLEVQKEKAVPGFKHDNMNEMQGLARGYEEASDDVKKVAYSIVKWASENSVDEIKNRFDIQPVEEYISYVHK